MYICIYVYVYSIYVYIYIYIHIVYMYIYIYIYTYVYTHYPARGTTAPRRGNLPRLSRCSAPWRRTAERVLNCSYGALISQCCLRRLCGDVFDYVRWLCALCLWDEVMIMCGILLICAKVLLRVCQGELRGSRGEWVEHRLTRMLYVITQFPLRPISLLRLSLLRFVDSDLPGDSRWTWEFHPFNLRLCLSQTLRNPES